MKTLHYRVRGICGTVFGGLELEHCGSFHKLTWPTWLLCLFPWYSGMVRAWEISMMLVFFGLEKITTDDHNLPMTSLTEVKGDLKSCP